MSRGYAYAHRFVDYSATSQNMDRAALRFIYGIRDRRENAVNLSQIEKYFKATPAEHTRKVVDRLVQKGYVLMLRSSASRKRTGYLYDLSNMGADYLYGDTVWDTPRGREPYERRSA